MIKYLLCFGWFFTFEVNAQNVVSVHLEDVLCQVKPYRIIKQVADSMEKSIRLYDELVYKHYPIGCTIGWDLARCEKWNSDLKRMMNKMEELQMNYSAVIDSLNNEVRAELKCISEQYCLLYKIDVFFMNNEPPLFGIQPKDVSEEFAAYIISFE